MTATVRTDSVGFDEIGRLSLGRVAVVRVGDGIEDGLSISAELTVGVTRLRTLAPLRLDERSIGMLTLATVPVDALDLTGPDQVRVPEVELRSCEAAIETFAHLLAIEHRLGYSISSPSPCIGFLSDSPDQLNELVGRTPVLPGSESLPTVARAKTGILDAKAVARLSDRLDGLALLADALGSRSAFAQYFDFIRLFERAFARKASALPELLVPFLVGQKVTAYAFTRREVHAWVKTRKRAAHADKYPDFLVEADFRPLIPRMEDAAYDVLLNKSEWRSTSTARRRLWRPIAGTLPDGIFVTQGKQATVRATLLDSHGAYPMLLAGPTEQLLPRGVWIYPDGRRKVLRWNGAASAPV